MTQKLVKLVTPDGRDYTATSDAEVAQLVGTRGYRLAEEAPEQTPKPEEQAPKPAPVKPIKNEKE